MEKRRIYTKGIRDGIPIGLGYFAVSFSLGIIARNAGLTPVMGFIASFFTRASAGEYGSYTLMAADGTYFELVLMCLITNLRYLLMSTALSQKFSPKTPLWLRVLTGCCVTDEVFGVSIAYPGYLEPVYTFGAFSISTIMWAAGTACGITAGNILPVKAVSALSVALYGMFIAIIIPPSKKDKAVLAAVIASFAISYICSVMPGISSLSSGTRTIILTILISSVVAIIKPIERDKESQDE